MLQCTSLFHRKAEVRKKKQQLLLVKFHLPSVSGYKYGPKPRTVHFFYQKYNTYIIRLVISCDFCHIRLDTFFPCGFESSQNSKNCRITLGKSSMGGFWVEHCVFLKWCESACTGLRWECRKCYSIMRNGIETPPVKKAGMTVDQLPRVESCNPPAGC